jgi:hypothetical protein
MTPHLLLLGLLGQATPAAEQGGCVFGPEEPSISEQLRPGLTAICAYDAPELNRRLLSLLRLPRRSFGIEAVEQAFSLPRLRTSYDQARTAHFSVVLQGAPANGRWRIMLDFDESFYPTDARGRPRFRGSSRPRLIDPRRRGDMRLDLVWLPQGSIPFGTPGCLSSERLIQAAQRSGWRAEVAPHMVMDAPPMLSLDLERDRMHGSSLLENDTGCIDDFLLTRDADPGAK